MPTILQATNGVKAKLDLQRVTVAHGIRPALDQATRPASRQAADSFSAATPPQSLAEFKSWLRVAPTAALEWLSATRPDYANATDVLPQVFAELEWRRSEEAWDGRRRWTGRDTDGLTMARAWKNDFENFNSKLKDNDESADKLWVVSAANPSMDWLETAGKVADTAVEPMEKAALIENLIVKATRSGNESVAVVTLAQGNNACFDQAEAYLAAKSAGHDPAVATIAWNSLHTDGARLMALAQILGDAAATAESRSLAHRWQQEANLPWPGDRP